MTNPSKIHITLKLTSNMSLIAKVLPVSKIQIGKKTPQIEKCYAKIQIGQKTPQIEKCYARINFRGNLFEYQTQLLKWARSLTKGIIGVDMGLGKTVMTIAIICERNYSKTIIVVPLAVMSQWKDMLTQFTDLLPNEIICYQGNHRNLRGINDARVIITTYDTLRIDIDNFSTDLYKYRERFDCLILDEAHRIRNSNTECYRACAKIVKMCPAKWLLTGTPIHNSINDLIVLAQFIGVNTGSHKDWKETYYYRLTKAECGIKLPEKILNDHYLNPDESHQEIYDNILQESHGSVLEKILRLRQCCNHPYAMLKKSHPSNKDTQNTLDMSEKFKEIINIIQSSPSDDKIIIFSQWTRSLQLIGELFPDLGIEFIEYNGSHNQQKKIDIIRQFGDTRRDKPIKVLLATISSAGVGLNLTMANHVILLDSWWGQALEEQAIDRVYRIGQTKTVYIHRLYMNNTIEEWMIEMKKEKYVIDTKFHNESLYHTINKLTLKTILQKYIN